MVSATTSHNHLQSSVLRAHLCANFAELSTSICSYLQSVDLAAQIGDRAQELAEVCGGRPLAAHMVGTALLSGTAQLDEVLQAVASPAVAHLQPLDRCCMHVFACLSMHLSVCAAVYASSCE